MKKRSVIYINFAQYDNTGRILDFLREHFEVVIQFSYDHLRLKNGRKTNYLRIYEHGILVEERKLKRFRTYPFLLFISLPIVAFSMVFETLYYIFILRMYYGRFDTYFTVNAFSAWIGIVAKRILLVRQTVFWVWDYFPINYPEWRMRLARWIYWRFDRPCMWYSDRLVFANKKLFTLRRDAGNLPKQTKAIIVPIGTTTRIIKKIEKKDLIIGFLGMIKSPQGIDMLIDSIPTLIQSFPKLRIEVLGSGPEEMRIKEKAKPYNKYITFYGFIEDQNEIEKIVQRWSIGTALYTPDESNESYWGDPSKIKVYISNGIPVITTNVSHFAPELEESKAGVIIQYGNYSDFVKAIKTIIIQQKDFQNNCISLAAKYNYQKIYPELFEDVMAIAPSS